MLARSYSPVHLCRSARGTIYGGHARLIRPTEQSGGLSCGLGLSLQLACQPRTITTARPAWCMRWIRTRRLSACSVRPWRERFRSPVSLQRELTRLGFGCVLAICDSPLWRPIPERPTAAPGIGMPELTSTVASPACLGARHIGEPSCRPAAAMITVCRKTKNMASVARCGPKVRPILETTVRRHLVQPIRVTPWIGVCRDSRHAHCINGQAQALGRPRRVGCASRREPQEARASAKPFPGSQCPGYVPAAQHLPAKRR